ncbi:MAG: heme-binding domain-containing protein [Anaerolineales bacterium]|nr:heme-binding domain-containing protein [Anaerolineales bacterium]MCB0010700.1 heme-binding domain-containing protein [Anaerolineales bacterium]MCB8960065.1 heme-binding domain-containing protein [Ardenticatenales bacterium]
MTLKRILMLIPVAIVGGFLLIQLVPYGRNHDNPAVTSEPNWDSPETRELAKTACFDCHSNETDWSPWYASVAPSSWLVQHDVEEGRQHLNFSEWNDGGRPRELDELWEVLEKGEMPPAVYILQHPEADLTPAQVEQLISGLQATVRN